MKQNKHTMAQRAPQREQKRVTVLPLMVWVFMQGGAADGH